MKLGFNITPLKNSNKFRGIGYYTENLLKELKTFTGLDIQEFESLSEIKKVDVVHYPFFDFFQYSLPLMKKYPTVVTIHDTIPLVFPKHYPVGIRGYVTNFFQSLSLKNVSAVITDSKSSKIDINKYLQVNLQKIYPINLAFTEEFRVLKDQKKLKNIKNKYKLPDKYVLYIGNVNWNKNLINLTQACIKADMNIVFIGNDFSKKNDFFHKELKSYKLFCEKFLNNKKVFIVGYVSTEDMVGIINLATLTLLPSYYEGFGLPILQSQACGIPVVTSNISSMPEIAGKGAILVDPYFVDDIVRGMKEAIAMRGQLVKAGFENIKRFSWRKTAEETIMVYQKILHV